MNYNNNSQMALNPLEIIQRRKWQLAGCLVLVCALAVSTVTLFAPKYEAAAQVKITASDTNSTSLGSLLGGNSSFNSQFELLKSDRVYELALARLNSDPTITTPFKMGILRESSKLKGDGRSQTINIVGVSEKAQLASAIANNLTSAFVETSAIMKGAQTSKVLDQMTDQILSLENNIRQKENELEEFRKSNNIIGNQTAYESSEKTISTLKQQLQNCTSKQVEIQNNLAILQKVTMDDLLDPLSIPLKSVREDSSIKSHLDEINNLQNKERQYSQTYLPGHRELQKVRQQITIAKDNLTRQTQTLLISLQKQNIESMTALDREVESINNSIKEHTSNAINNTDVYTKLKRLNSEIADINSMREKLYKDIQQYKFNQKLISDPVVVVNAAKIPDSTAGVSPRKRAGTVLIIGVVLSFMLAFGQEKLKQADTYSNEYALPIGFNPYAQFIPNYMNMNFATGQYPPNIDNQGGKKIEVLGRISDISKTKPGYEVNESLLYSLVHTSPHSAQAEQYREISTSLLSRFSKTKQSIVITGNEPKSGKTVLTCNLAHLLAQAGRSVAIVSATPESDKISKAFNTGKTIYADLLLSNNYNLDDYVCHTDTQEIATLKIDLDNRPDTAELSQAISALNWKLQSRFDWILYDTASIGYNDTDNILQVIGKAIFVSRFQSNESKIMTTEQIEQRGAVSLGCVEMASNSSNVRYQHA